MLLFNTCTHGWVCVHLCVLTCSILQRLNSQASSTQGWYMPSVMQFNNITSIEIRSNHVLMRKSIVIIIQLRKTQERENKEQPAWKLLQIMPQLQSMQYGLNQGWRTWYSCAFFDRTWPSLVPLYNFKIFKVFNIYVGFNLR